MIRNNVWWCTSLTPWERSLGGGGSGNNVVHFDTVTLADWPEKHVTANGREAAKRRVLYQCRQCKSVWWETLPLEVKMLQIEVSEQDLESVIAGLEVLIEDAAVPEEINRLRGLSDKLRHALINKAIMSTTEEGDDLKA